MDLIIPVVLAGGTGSRLWPLSRSSHPKQLLTILGGDNTLLQETLLRCSKISPASPFIIYNEDYHYQVLEQFREMGINSPTLLIEPAARNTAPAIAMAAFEAIAKFKDAYLFVMPADHYLDFNNEVDVANRLTTAKSLADRNCLVTFGVKPTAAESGYGYIQTGEVLGSDAFSIAKFIEKPPQEQAETYLNDERFYWNSGMFFFRATSYLRELEIFAPEIYHQCQDCYSKSNKVADTVRIDQSFLVCPSLSIDYAVMEKTQTAAIIPLDAAWSDVGSWSSIFDIRTKDENGNVVQGDVIAEESRNCYVHSSSRLVVTIGLEDQIVVETKDSVLVAHKDKSQAIKRIVERLVTDNRVEACAHPIIHRPWGDFEVLIDTPNYKVKKLHVKVGSSLSLQRHKHRSEHWVVVSGTATITNGDDHLILYPSQSTYIPRGSKHRLSNFGDKPLEIIEVQLGEYLGEDDIERFEDLYGRSEKTFIA